LDKLMKLLTIAAFMLSTTAAIADNLTILNTGSDSGSWAAITTALSADLATNYTVDFQNPGKNCVAINSNLPNISGPVLLPWGNDLEAAGRDGEGCATLKVLPEQIIAYAASPLFVCHIKDLDIVTDSGKVGYTTPVYPKVRLVDAINSSFNTTHVGISYDGSGDAVGALLSGELDYALLTEKHANKVVKEGAICDTNTSTEGENALISKYPTNEDLVVEFTTVLLAINADTQPLKPLVKAAYDNKDRAFGQFTGSTGYLWSDSETLAVLYENSVKKMQK
jgi:hypothetical protein